MNIQQFGPTCRSFLTGRFTQLKTNGSVYLKKFESGSFSVEIGEFRFVLHPYEAKDRFGRGARLYGHTFIWIERKGVRKGDGYVDGHYVADMANYEPGMVPTHL